MLSSTWPACPAQVQGQCFQLKSSLIGEAIRAQAGLWVSDCMALMQVSRAGMQGSMPRSSMDNDA